MKKSKDLTSGSKTRKKKVFSSGDSRASKLENNNFKKEKVLKGVAASPGVAIGPLFTLKKQSTSFSLDHIVERKVDNVNEEINRFQSAIHETRSQILSLKKHVSENANKESDAQIFDAHLLIVDDKILMAEVVDVIKQDQIASDLAFYNVMNRYITAMSAMPDEYIKERAADIKDVAERVLHNLCGTSRVDLSNVPSDCVIVAHDLNPSDTALLDASTALGFITEVGSRTAHTAILARSMRLPAVVGVPNLISSLDDDISIVIVDGFVGDVIINPTEMTLEKYEKKLEKSQRLMLDFLEENSLRTETIDGYSIKLEANIDNSNDVQNVLKYGASDVGLFRTEYLYINRVTLPSEDELYNEFVRVIKKLPENASIVIRTLDVGGDKLIDNISTNFEHNPFLGLRAIRLCLRERKELLQTQLRAMLRASALGKVRILFPMVTAVEEVVQLKRTVEEIKIDLKKSRIDFYEDVRIGIMIETPAAALIAENLAYYVDFFCIGTNDLVQYTMAADRGNERVAYLYQEAHPAVLKLIHMVAKAAHNHAIPVAVCGEAASNPYYIPFFIGLGIYALSVTPTMLGSAKRVIRALRMNQAQDAVWHAMQSNTEEEALNYSFELLRKIAPDIVELMR
ncbi:phosphoenolpyruvate--protein phosphotransferase [Lentisphaerota bacterium WC36G]|nr:phosphoenolpyruvate--protein phosphotransferase [Lentisphaerae bacterium WC36]